MFSDEIRKSTDKKMVQIRDVLNTLLAPRRWVQDSRNVTQFVAGTQATREDVINLQVRRETVK